MNAPTERILIVDDTQQNIQVLGTILKEASYRITVARNGQEALDSARKVRPDLILLDVMMPVMDGFETCRRLKADPKTAEIPIIFLTSKSDSEDVVRGFELGAVDYVTKPFNAAELFVRVDAHLARRRLQLEVERRLQEIERLRQEQEFLVSRELGGRVEPLLRAAEALRRPPQGLDGPQQQALSTIVEGIDSLRAFLRTLERLRDFGKGGYDLDKQSVQLDQLLRRVISDLELTFGSLASFVYQNQLSDPRVPADPDLLTGVFHGLIKHAVERAAASLEGGGPVVRIVVTETAGQVTVQVRHRTPDGPPLPSEGPADDGSEPGSSLGYALLVARAHGGTVQVEAGDETTLTLTLAR
jgi:DNA-binding response OmpR family regulator